MDLAWEPVETVHKLKLQKLKVAMYQNVETQQMLAVNQLNQRLYGTGLGKIQSLHNYENIDL